MANTQKHGLGSGLEALIPKNFDPSLLIEANEKVQKLPLGSIEANSQQPRKTFDDAALNELAASIKEHGVIQPIIVTPLNNGKYRLVAGERRLRASVVAKESTIPAVVRSLKNLESLEVAMIENVQRVDLNPVEQALAIERLHHEFSMSYETVAKKLGKAKSTIGNTARLLQLPGEAIEALNTKIITEGHARALLSLKNYPKHQKLLLEHCKNGWSVRQAERYVVGVKSGVVDIDEAKARVSLDTPETKALGEKLGTSVHVRRMAKGGRLEIVFNSDSELKRIIDRIN